MESGNYFSIYEQTKATNENISLVFTPDSLATYYRYYIYKDNEKYKEYLINNNSNSFINFNETGNYQIVVIEYFNDTEKELKSGIYKIDKDAPIIEVDNLLVEMQQGATLDIMGGVKAYDNQDGDLTKKVTTNEKELDFKTTGIKKLIYTVTDEAGNTTNKTININVLKGTTNSLLVVQTAIITVLVLVTISIVYLKKSIEKEKRIARHSLDELNDKSKSLFDKYSDKYYKLILKVKKYISNFELIKKYAKNYDKYVYVVNQKYKEGLDFVANKILISFTFIFLAIFSKTIQYELLQLYEICLPLVIGFFIPDIIYKYVYKRHCLSLENDLLQAIMIMNNAFKSGRSITQAIYLVTVELNGTIAREFKKVYNEINLGLSVETAFQRLQERVPVEEVNYLTASIGILNRTGGNIVKVFTSIEKTLFNKKKLKLELNSLTGSSRIISYVLFAVPLLFVLFISLLDQTYFVPFFTTTLGLILLVIMLLIYAIYIVCVTRMMKVKV